MPVNVSGLLRMRLMLGGGGCCCCEVCVVVGLVVVVEVGAEFGSANWRSHSVGSEAAVDIAVLVVGELPSPP